MERPTDRTLFLATVRARVDPGFPDVVFVTMRRHLLPGEANEAAVDLTSPDAAADLLRHWLAEFASNGLDNV